MKIRAAIAVAVAAALASVPAHAAAPQGYGFNDAGGFRNVLPPGQVGTDNALQLAQFNANGARPEHFADQLPLYTDLLYASPNLKNEDVPKYFKDATFGVKPEDVARTYSPRPGVTIIRDKAYGVPRIYGDTDEDVTFGAGYVAGEDRLFFIDVLRNTARGRLSSFAGGSASNRRMDRVQWGIAPYTEADLQKQIDNAPKLYGGLGTEMVARLKSFVDGINAYIDEAMLNPNKLPAEYAAFGKVPQHWTPTDVIAEASLVGGIFGKGGGNEVGSAQVLNELVKRFGPAAGRRSWADFRSKNDPEAPTTVLKKRFPYETTSAFAKRGLAIPDPGSVQDVAYGPAIAPAASETRGALGAELLRTFGEHPLASNWEMVSARESATGHPIGVLGPQVGYYIPQVLIEEELHGPHFDARGTAFPGVNLMVQLGHGRDYAWSATTATSDNIDTFAEVLCQDDVHYLYKGECRPFDVLEQSNSWTPNASDKTPPGSETLTALRSVHGIVYARGTVKGKKVAFVHARTTYFHEADSAIGFFRLNDPTFVHDPQSFRQAVGGIQFLFNWGYIDADNIAYQLSGALPVKAKGTSPDFPVLGTGQYDWQGFDPELQTSKTVPLDQRPHAVNQAYLVSWNNKQAPGFAAADDKFTFGSIYRSQMIEARVKRGIAGPQKMRIEQLVQAMEEPASEDIRGLALVPVLSRAIGKPADPKLRAALATLKAWRATGAHRRDLDRDGKADDGDPIAIMDAWYPLIVDAEFGPAIGDGAMKALRGMTSYPRIGGEGTTPSAPAFSDGWWGFVHKDLRGIFDAKHVKGRWSRGYCGGGKRPKCRALLRTTLAKALTVTRQQLYAHGDCTDTPDAACYDQNRWTVASAIGVPPFPFQNRPTFQQIVELTRHLPR
ncbi:MAG: Penicillin amidase [Solirubrobacterales bacterium]|nr:Penicillin amidase [Solirubrobacterales bacterium]